MNQYKGCGMAGAYTVALVGFAQSESATFESFFRLAARRPPAYKVQDEVLDAQVLLVNADNPQAVHLVRYAELPGKVLLIGTHDAGTGWPLQRKPVKLVEVLATMDRLLGVRAETAKVKGVKNDRPGRSRHDGESEFPPTQPQQRQMAEHPPVAAQVPMPPLPKKEPGGRAAPPGVMRLTDFGGLEELPVAAPRTRAPRAAPSRFGRSTSESKKAPVAEVQRGDVLLVAQSLVEGRILHKRFKRYGLTIDWSREAAQALAMLKVHAYRMVVIDRLTGEPDANQVCRESKQCRLPNGQSPVVLMFAPTAGSMDRIKAGLAGCDAYLSRSVNEADLYKVLAQHRLVSLDGFEKTNMGF